MGSRRWTAAALAVVVMAAGAVLVAPEVASADGVTPLGIHCTGIPIVSTLDSTANVEAHDDVDPVQVGGTVNNTLHVPVPVTNPPVDVTVTEVKITVPIPAGVTIDNVTFTPSSFTGQSWAVNGSSLIATFTGNIVIKSSGGAPPTVPDVQMATTVAGPPRTIEWKAPSSVVAKASTFLGPFTATCAATEPNTVLLSTTVVNPNQPPTATDQAVSVAYGTPKAITLTGTDPEASPLSFATTSSPAHGLLTGTPPNLTYTPTAGYSGPDSFTFTASDGSLLDSGTVTITVGPKPNTAPTATDQSVSVTHDTPKAITLTGTDPESDPLTFTKTSDPSHGVVTGAPPNLTYTPTSGYSGPDSFTFTASDGSLSDSGTIAITVGTPANTAPTATDQAVSVAFATPKAITLAGTDPESNPLTFAVASSPAHGVLTGTAPNLTYAPAAGYAGPDSFTFTASDGSLSDTGTVSITVAPARPGVPTGVVASVVSEGVAKVSWMPPADTGGSPILGYEVIAFQDGAATPWGNASPGTTSATLDGVDNGVPVTFTVAAINAVGTGTAASSNAVTTQWWLPWSSGPVAVTELITWMTGKAPTAAAKASWLAQMNAGTKLPSDLVAELREETDATTNVDPTVRLYSAYLTRIPDASGLNFWLNRRRAGWTLSKISNNFASSPEFIRRYGSMTNRKFVENIYQYVLERTGEKSGIDYWTKQLDTKKKNRGQVMINFSESNEYKNKQVERTQAAVIFIHVLGKTPTIAERDALIADIDEAGLRTTVRERIAMASFANRAG